MAFFAHSDLRPDRADWQPLREHLHNVAELAKGFALAARPGDAEFAQSAYVAGLLHDLAKSRPEFQEYIRGYRGKSESTRHKQLDAAHAWVSRRPTIARPIVMTITGHVLSGRKRYKVVVTLVEGDNA